MSSKAKAEMNLVPFMARWHMLPREGETILCAVSGGRDSVCLLHYLWTLGKKRGFQVAAVHMDHGQRSTARRDAEFVRGLCEQLSVPFYLYRRSVPEMARHWGVGLEEAGRRLRYEVFDLAAEKAGAALIATAHHADDQAETVLLNLLRGTGAEGLAGIPPVRGKIVRPLLETSRREIERYLERNGLPHVEDETNEDLTLGRNRLRREIMPGLRQVHPGAEENICRTAQLLRRENEYLDALAAAYLPEEGTSIPRERLLQAPQVLRLRALRLLCGRLPVGRKDFAAVHYEAMSGLIEKGTGRLSLPGGAAALCRDGAFRLEMTDAAPDRMPLPMGESQWGHWTILCREVSEKDEGPDGGLLLSQTGEDLSVGACPGGARLRLAGSRGGRTVKRLCADRGISPGQRDLLPGIFVGDALGAVWLLGTDETFQPRETGGRMIKITCMRAEKTQKERKNG